MTEKNIKIELSDKFISKLIHSTFGEKYNISFVQSFVEWFISSKYRQYKRLDKFIKDQVDNPTELVQQIANAFKKYKDYDERIIQILRFVRGYTRYVSDLEQYNTEEHWGSANDTLISREGDCDNLNSLIHILGLVSGIPSYLLYSVIGNVPEGGHYWLVYLSPKTGKLYDIDATYYYDSTFIKNRRSAKKYKMWYVFNDKSIYRPIWD